MAKEITLTILGLSLCLVGSCGTTTTYAAENLKLREGISFYQDIDSDFPIIADKMDDDVLCDRCATLVFFGARGDLNTNRQAKRLVDLYKQYSADKVKFVVVDVDHLKNDEGRQLVKKYYHGYIPDQVLLDKSAHVVWTQIGEIDEHLIAKAIDKAL